ncbi:hypothetical protein [Wenyingzhuangia sp. IMCC45467]
MKKYSIIAILMTVLTVLFLSDFRLLETVYLIPNFLWAFPLYGFYFLSSWYFSIAFKTKLKTIQKILIIILGGIGIVSLLSFGFSIWKINGGNILSTPQETFQINLKNIFFWVVYQSYLFLFFFSAFKQLVTLDQK